MDRHVRRRLRAKQLKRDCAMLLDRIVRGDAIPQEIAEMRERLQPCPGVAAPIILTRYPK